MNEAILQLLDAAIEIPGGVMDRWLRAGADERSDYARGVAEEHVKRLKDFQDSLHTYVYVAARGMHGWNKNGYPVVRPGGPLA